MSALHQLQMATNWNKGIDAFTQFLLHFDNNVTDSSPNAITVTNNSVTFDATNKVFGSHAASFNGSSSNLTVPDSSIVDLTSGDFTIDFRLRAANTTGTKWIVYKSATGAFAPYVIGQSGAQLTISMSANGSSFGIANGRLSGTIVANTYTHVALVRSGSTFLLFQDGVQIDTWSSASNLVNNAEVLTISGQAGSNFLNGQVDEFRICNTARWTAAFTPPAIAYGY